MTKIFGSWIKYSGTTTQTIYVDSCLHTSSNLHCTVCLDQNDPCSYVLLLTCTMYTICSRSRVRPKMTRSGKWSRKGTTAAAATTPAVGADLDNSKVGQRQTAQDWKPAALYCSHIWLPPPPHACLSYHKTVLVYSLLDFLQPAYLWKRDPEQ